jgi:hypothetical protein
MKGQLVELVSLQVLKRGAEADQHKQSCLVYGRALIGSDLDNRISFYTEKYKNAIKMFVSGSGTIMFLHLRKSGGTFL